MAFPLVATLATLLFVYALVSRRLSDTSLSGPMVFVTFGIGAALVAPSLEGLDFGEGALSVLAEYTLVIVLFSDATRLNVGKLREQAGLPARLLGIGLPLQIALGTVAGMVLLPSWAIGEVAVLAAVLAPTDAALGRAVVTDERVPVRIRQALNIESGLNDGLALPAITVLLAVAGAELAASRDWVGFVGAQLGWGVSAGVLIGAAGGWALDHAVRRGWVEGALRQLATLAVGIAAFATAEALGGNGFVSAFVGGLTFGAVARDQCENAADFAEDEGQLLTLLTFFFFGAVLVLPSLEQVTLRTAIYAVLTLTIVRMLPVAVSMIGTGLLPRTIAYLGWFGPRGLASIVFGLLVVETLDAPAADEVLAVVVLTALISIFAHGLTAVGLTSRYAASLEDRRSARDDMPEHITVEDLRTRT